MIPDTGIIVLPAEPVEMTAKPLHSTPIHSCNQKKPIGIITSKSQHGVDRSTSVYRYPEVEFREKKSEILIFKQL